MLSNLKSKIKDMNKAACIAVFGTGSEVGKSIVATALCRYFANRGISVSPFKSQNMSNNSGITSEGLEMGRAQIVQAEAAGIPPHVDMNPVLLKPTSDVGSQVILLGKVLENNTAVEYHAKKEHLFSMSQAALDRLRRKYDLVIMEGAGSCAEVNLMQHDIVNFPMAEYAGANVILVADIHRGGVFGQIVGTLECLPKKQRNRIKGFIINRFRGDISLFKEGIKWLEKKTDKKVFGVLPWFNHINIEAEDSVVIENLPVFSKKKCKSPSIAVIRIPHISNFTDFDPLSSLKGISLYFIEKPQDLRPFKAVILPGSKNTRSDLKWMNKRGWSKRLKEFAGQGGHILGICGGYQMLGHYVHDPNGLEGVPGKEKGLAFLPVETVLKAPKTTTLSRFFWQDVAGTGYEIHMGYTKRLKGDPMFNIFEQNRKPCKKEDGCITRDSRIMGTYIHGLFDTPGITRLWLNSIGLSGIKVSKSHGFVSRDKQYDLLADHFEKYIDTEGIIAGGRFQGSGLRRD
jgi:adenosylcobyric acid synthase